MNHNAGNHETELYLEESTPAFRLFVVYDSQDASATAATTSDFVIHELGEEIPVDKVFWNARLLTTPGNREHAANQAASADMLIVALSNNHFASEIREWAEQWQQQRRQEGGLLAVLPQNGTETSNELIEYLREAAISANMDFLCRSGDGRPA